MAEWNREVHERVSAGRLNLWFQCPLAFQFCHIDGVRRPTFPATAALGCAAERVMALLCRHVGKMRLVAATTHRDATSQRRATLLMALFAGFSRSALIFGAAKKIVPRD